MNNILRANHLQPGMWVIEKDYPDEEPIYVSNVKFVPFRGGGYYKVMSTNGFFLNVDANDEFILVDEPKEQRYQIRCYNMYSSAESPIIDDIWAISEEDAVRKYEQQNPNAVGVSATLW